MQMVSRGHMVLVVKLSSVVVGYLFVGVLAARLTPAGFGQVSVFLSLAALISVIGARGQHMALLRFLPGAGAGRAALLGASRRRATRATAMLAGLLMLAGLALHLAGYLPGFTPLVLGLGVMLGAVAGWADFLAHRARAEGRLLLSILPKELFWRMFAIGLFLLVLPEGSGAVPALAVLVSSLMVLNLMSGLALPRLASSDPAPKGWHRASGAFWLGSVSNLFLAHADTAVVGLILGPVPAGVYFVANRLAQVLGFFMMSQNIVISPELARAHENGDRRALANIAQRATRAMSAPTLVAGLALWLAAEPVLALFGPDFVAAAPALRWLILAAGLNAITGPGDIVMNMAGQEHAAMHIAAGSLAAGVLFLPLGALLGGAEGVACAVLIATALRKAAYLAALKARLGLRVDLAAGMAA